MSEIEFLKTSAVTGRMSRRDFLGRMGALGVGAPLASSMLSSAVLAAGPQYGGTMRLGIRGGTPEDSLDPAHAANQVGTIVTRLWGEPLVDLAEDEGLEGKVAETFSGSADGKTWTFRIRQGITFSNGKAVTAEDAVASLRRHADPETGSGGAGVLSGISNIRAEGSDVIITLEQPNVDLPYLLTDRHLIIQPNGGYDAPEAAIGTGRYILKQVNKGELIVAEKNPNHWDALGYASTIELHVINDDAARVQALVSGQVDMIDRVPPNDAAAIQTAAGLNLHQTSGPGHYVFVMHTDTAPFDNNDLRLALKYAINREEMVEKVLRGLGSVGNDSPINASYPLFTPIEQRRYDPDLAAYHLRKSGHSGPITLRTSNNSFVGAPEAAKLFKASAAQAGIELDIQMAPEDSYWSEVWNKQPFCTSYWGGRPTQDQMFTTAYLSTSGWNDTRFNNPQFDQLLVAARSEADQSKRRQMYADMANLQRDNGGLICPMFNDFVDATSDRLAGWKSNVKGFALMNAFAPHKMWVTT